MPTGLGGDAVDKLALFKDVINVAKEEARREDMENPPGFAAIA
jgi:hypothetical protein